MVPGCSASACASPGKLPPLAVWEVIRAFAMMLGHMLDPVGLYMGLTTKWCQLKSLNSWRFHISVGQPQKAATQGRLAGMLQVL